MTREELLNSLPKNNKCVYYCQRVLWHNDKLGDGLNQFQAERLEDLQPKIDAYFKKYNYGVNTNIEYGRIYTRTETYEYNFLETDNF